MKQIRFYSLVSRVPFLRSYTAKFIFIALLCNHVPVTVAIFFHEHLHGAPHHLNPLSPIPVIAVSALLMAFTLRGLLRPVNLCSQALRDYMDRGLLPNLPVTYIDQAGTAMADLQRSLTCLDQLLKEREREAHTDMLTGVGNRAWGEEKLHRALDRTPTDPSPFCLAVLDIDRFKSINDSYGHETGDRAIRHLVGVLSRAIRSEDWLARWGGDEFVVFFRNCDAEQAREIVDRVYALLNDSPFVVDERTEQNLSISVGLCQCGDSSQETARTLFGKADRALYEAKASGRGRMVIRHEESVLQRAA